MIESNLTLYDIPCAKGLPWSPNTEKTRLSLNFKGLKYTTIYLEYPDIKPTLSALGVAPHSTGPTEYTLPALQIDSGVPFMESLDHVRYLDKTYPDLPILLPLDAEATLTRLDLLLRPLFPPLFKLIVSDVQKSLLGPLSSAYFRETREKALGCPLDSLAGEEGSPEREQLHVALQKAMQPVADLLKAKTGPFFDGTVPTFVDLKFTAVLVWALRGNKEVWEKMVSVDKSVETLWEATRPWREGSGL